MELGLGGFHLNGVENECWVHSMAALWLHVKSHEILTNATAYDINLHWVWFVVHVSNANDWESGWLLEL